MLLRLLLHDADEELRCVRLAAPALAKACAMELKAGLRSAQDLARATAARRLLAEAQRPLSTLNTFGAMLLPRLEEGDPDRDMATGILVQVGPREAGEGERGRRRAGYLGVQGGG